MGHYDEFYERDATLRPTNQTKPSTPKSVKLYSVGSFTRDIFTPNGEDEFEMVETDVYPETVAAVLPGMPIKIGVWEHSTSLVVCVPFTPVSDNSQTLMVVGDVENVRRALGFAKSKIRIEHGVLCVAEDGVVTSNPLKECGEIGKCGGFCIVGFEGEVVESLEDFVEDVKKLNYVEIDRIPHYLHPEIDSLEIEAQKVFAIIPGKPRFCIGSLRGAYDDQNVKVDSLLLARMSLEEHAERFVAPQPVFKTKKIRVLRNFNGEFESQPSYFTHLATEARTIGDSTHLYAYIFEGEPIKKGGFWVARKGCSVELVGVCDISRINRPPEEFVRAIELPRFLDLNEEFFGEAE